MNSLRNISIVLAIAILSISCEDIIQLDLMDNDPRIVIEGSINATAGIATVIISETNGFYENADPIMISNAAVTILSTDGKIHSLVEIEDGVYELAGIEVDSRTEYTLTVKTNTDEYSAIVAAPSKVSLISLEKDLITAPFGDQDSFYQLSATWQDMPGESNFYRVRSFVEGELLDNSIILFKEGDVDGEEITRTIMNRFEAGNLLQFELMSIDRTTYDYFQQIQANSSQGLASSVPFNPKGNLTNNALGYFGIFESSIQEIQL